MVQFRFVAKDGTKIIIREPRHSDARAAMDYINAFADEKLSGILVDKKVTLKEEKKWLAHVVRGNRKRAVVFLMAFIGPRVVGTCSIGKMQYRKQSHRAGLGIGVAADMRRKGIGEEIFRRSLQLAKKRLKGMERIELSHFSYNKRAHALYKKLGFREIHRIKRAVKEGNRYYDEIVMHLDL